MNPSSDVCKKCLVVGHLCTKWYFGFDPCCLVFQVNNISSDHSILLHFDHNISQSYIGTRVVHLYLCHVTRTIAAFRHTNNECLLFSQLSWWHSANLGYLHLGRLTKTLDTCHWSEQCLGDYRCCSHLCPDYIVGHRCFAPYHASNHWH